ncbi:MAG: YfcE family phosphodiesterase, partial [Bacteroidota bacterium]|nr:YfcE family phosphodiesterase [Bacteroidota bacterium]
MPKDTVHIGLLSDTHGHWDDRITHHLSGCDEIWHAGDVGSLAVLDAMQQLGGHVRVVFGNIDDHRMRSETAETLHWEIQGLRFCMTHIGGRPGRYAKGIRSLLDATRPDVFICGHSHLLKVQKDPSFGGL